MADRLTAQLSRSEDLIEALKVADLVVWAARMNSIRAQVREIVNNELIYN